jgi:hypothetical protein
LTKLADQIARAVGRIENRYKLTNLLDIAAAENGLTFRRNLPRIAEEARLDGFYADPAVRLTRRWREGLWPPDH